MKIIVTEFVPNQRNGHHIVIETEDEKPGVEKKLFVLGRDVTEALADNKVTFFEGLKILADLTGLQ